MDREFRDLLYRLSEAERRAQAAIDAGDADEAERCMAEVRDLRAAVTAAKARERQDKQEGAARVATLSRRHAAGAFGRAIIEAGFDLRERPVVTVPLAAAFPSEEDLSPRRSDGITPLGRDQRWLFPLLPSQDLDEDTAIQDFRQTARTVTGSVERDPTATTAKATLDVGVELVVEKARQFAVVIENIPNQVLESLPTARAFFEAEGRFVVSQAIDAHVMAQILAANPPSSFTGDNLVERVRHAIAAMRAAGVNPDVLVVDPADAVALDLFKQPGTGDYAHPSRETGVASPLWGLRVVERAGHGEPPVLIDSRALGVWYRGVLRVAADPFTGFKQNLTNLRFEVNGLMHVRNPKAAHLIVEQALLMAKGGEFSCPEVGTVSWPFVGIVAWPLTPAPMGRGRRPSGRRPRRR